MCPTTVFAKKMASDTKAVVAAMMKLPKAQRLEQLLAMSAECVARREDAAPLLSLIQLELDSPDDADDEAPARTTSSAAPAMPKKKSVRRQLKERRDELRAMVAKVDAALGSSGGSSAASTHGKGPDAVTFAHLSRGQQLQLARERKSSGAEVPEHIKERFRAEYDADPEAFRKLWHQQTPEFRQQFLEPSRVAMPPTPKPPTPKPPTPSGTAGIQPPRSAESSTGRLSESEIEALLRRSQPHGGGKAKVKDAPGAGRTSSSIF